MRVSTIIQSVITFYYIFLMLVINLVSIFYDKMYIFISEQTFGSQDDMPNYSNMYYLLYLLCVTVISAVYELAH